MKSTLVPSEDFPLAQTVKILDLCILLLWALQTKMTLKSTLVYICIYSEEDLGGGLSNTHTPRMVNRKKM